MTELIDNLTQLLMALLGFVFSGTGYLKRRHRPLFLLSCFYGCFALGTLYWLLYTQLITDSPPIFYVSDISWISCFLFLLLLEFDVAGEGLRVYKCRASWLALAVEIPLTVYFISIGDVIYNIIIGALMTVMYWQGIRSAVWARRHERCKLAFYLVLLCFLTLENCLWAIQLSLDRRHAGKSIFLVRLRRDGLDIRAVPCVEKDGGRMTYIENVFACVAAPLLVAALCMGKKYLRFFLFAFAGMGTCLLSAYVNTFFAALYGASAFHATAEIAPVVEEVMKLLPLLFISWYLNRSGNTSSRRYSPSPPGLPPSKTSATSSSTERTISASCSFAASVQARCTSPAGPSSAAGCSMCGGAAG